MAITKRELQIGKLPANLTKEDVAALKSKLGVLRRLLSGPNAEHNRNLIDAALAGKSKPKPGCNANSTDRPRQFTSATVKETE